MAALAMLNPPYSKNIYILGQPIGLFAIAFAMGTITGVCAAWASLRRRERLKWLGMTGFLMNAIFLLAFAVLALVPIRALW